MYAILFVVLVVFVFLGRWRATVIICITIPTVIDCLFYFIWSITDGGVAEYYFFVRAFLLRLVMWWMMLLLFWKT